MALKDRDNMYKDIKRNGTTMLLAGALLTAAVTFPQSAHAELFPCHPTNIDDWHSFIVVTCSNPVSIGGQSVNSIAINVAITGNPIAVAPAADISRFVSFATAALLSGKLFVAWVPTTGTTFGGCNASNCRVANTSGLGI
jgi:hypothetical protein